MMSSILAIFVCLCVCVCICVRALLSHVQLFAIPLTVCSSPSSSVHGIVSARVLEWVAVSFYRGSYKGLKCGKRCRPEAKGGGLSRGQGARPQGAGPGAGADPCLCPPPHLLHLPGLPSEPLGPRSHIQAPRTPLHHPSPTPHTRPSLSLLSANTKPYILVCDKSLFNCLKEEIH